MLPWVHSAYPAARAELLMFILASNVVTLLLSQCTYLRLLLAECLAGRALARVRIDVRVGLAAAWRVQVRVQVRVQL